MLPSLRGSELREARRVRSSFRDRRCVSKKEMFAAAAAIVDVVLSAAHGLGQPDTATPLMAPWVGRTREEQGFAGFLANRWGGRKIMECPGKGSPPSFRLRFRGAPRRDPCDRLTASEAERVRGVPGAASHPGCAYDRPGTTRSTDALPRNHVRQPTTAQEGADLHACGAAKQKGPTSSSPPGC